MNETNASSETSYSRVSKVPNEGTSTCSTRILNGRAVSVELVET